MAVRFSNCGGMVIFAGKANNLKWRNDMSFAQKCYEVFERSVKDYHAGEECGKEVL